MSGRGLGRKGRPVNRKAGTDGPGKRGAGKAADHDAFDHWLEDKLRNAYSSVLEEPIPDELLKLLQQKLKD
jgi:hypothetical protein